MDLNLAEEIIRRYGIVLEQRKYSVGYDKDLYEKKDVIREAIRFALATCSDSEYINKLEIAYIELETFVPKHDFNIVKKYENLQKKMTLSSNTNLSKTKKIALKIANFKDFGKYTEIQDRIANLMNERLKEVKDLRQNKSDS